MWTLWRQWCLFMCSCTTCFTSCRYADPMQGLWWLCMSPASFPSQAFMCISKLVIKKEWFHLKNIHASKYNKVVLIEMWSVEEANKPATRLGRKITLMKTWERCVWAWCWPWVSLLWLTPVEVCFSPISSQHWGGVDVCAHFTSSKGCFPHLYWIYYHWYLICLALVITVITYDDFYPPQ